jgi:hypothetical protein
MLDDSVSNIRNVGVFIIAHLALPESEATSIIFNLL